MPSLLARLAAAFPGFRGRPTISPPDTPPPDRFAPLKALKEKLENTPSRSRPSSDERIPTNYHSGIAGKVWFLPYQDTTTKDSAEVRAAMRLMRRDGYVKAAWEPQILTVASEDWQVQASEPGNSGSEEQAAFCKTVIEDYLEGGMISAVRAVCAPFGSDGFSLAEKVTGQATRGRLEKKIVLTKLAARDVDSQTVRLQGDKFGNVTGVQSMRSPNQEVFPISDFVYSRYMTVFDEPLGEAAFRPAYGAYWMRDTVRKLRIIHCEKRMAGTLKGTYSNDDDKPTLESAMRLAKTATWISIPEGTQVEAMALSTASEPDYRSFDESLRDEIVTAIAFATLQIIQGNVPDARGDSKTQKAMADLGPWFLMSLVSEAFNKQVFPDLIDWNFPYAAGGGYPKLTFGAVSNSELTELLTLVTGLKQLGFDPSRKHYAKAFSLQEADKDDPKDSLNFRPEGQAQAGYPPGGGGFPPDPMGGGSPAMLPPGIGPAGGGMQQFSENVHYEFAEPIKWSRIDGGKWKSSGGRVLSDESYQKHLQNVGEQVPAAKPVDAAAPTPPGSRTGGGKDYELSSRSAESAADSEHIFGKKLDDHQLTTLSGYESFGTDGGYQAARTKTGSTKAVGSGANAGRVLYGVAATKALAAQSSASQPKPQPSPQPPAKPNEARGDSLTERTRARQKDMVDLSPAVKAGNPQAVAKMKEHAAAGVEHAANQLAKAPPEAHAEIVGAFQAANPKGKGPAHSAVGNFLSGLIGSDSAGISGKIGGLVNSLGRLGGKALKLGVQSLARFAWSATKGVARGVGGVVASDTVRPFLYWAGAVAAGAAIMAAPVLAVSYGLVSIGAGIGLAPVAVAATVKAGRMLGSRAAGASFDRQGQHWANQSEGFSEKDVALAGPDGLRANALLSHAQADVSRLFAEKCRAATERLLASDNPQAAAVLFDDDELSDIASGMGRVIATADLLGRARIRRHAEFADARQTFAEVRTDPFHDFAEPIPVLAPLKAIDYIRRLVPGVSAGPDRYGSRLDRHAFTLAVASDEVLLQKIKDAIVMELSGAGDATPSIDAILEAAGVAPKNPQYGEMIARTNAMLAYNQGASDEMATPDMREAFPAWEYNGILDNRTGDDHRPRIGKYYPSSARFEDVRGPRVFNCRCTHSPISKHMMDGIHVEERW